jgi:hypothetical protein
MIFFSYLLVPLFFKNKNIIKKQSLKLNFNSNLNNIVELNDYNFVESWDDGEVEWDLDSLNNNNNIFNLDNYNSYLSSQSYSPPYNDFIKNKNDINLDDEDDNMDDGEVIWDLINTNRIGENYIISKNINTQSYSNNFGMKGDSDSEKIWLFLEKMKNNEINTIVKELHSLLFTTDNLFYDITDIQEKTNDFQILIALLTFISYSNTSNKIMLRKKFKASVTASFIILLILTRGVRSAS